MPRHAIDPSTPPTSHPLVAAFGRLRERLLRATSRLLGNEADAEDALQDAFVRLWQTPAAARSEQEAAALLTTTVRHLSIDTLRRRAHEAERDVDELRGDEPADEADAAAQREQTLQRVEQLLSTRLTPTQRQVVQLREVEGRSFDDIAARLKLQPAAVRMHLSRARKTIRECYLKQYEEEV